MQLGEVDELAFTTPRRAVPDVPARRSLFCGARRTGRRAPRPRAAPLRRRRSASNHLSNLPTNMAIINQATKELQVKIVYYGPAKSGKTTNLEQVHKNVQVPEPRREGQDDLARHEQRSHAVLRLLPARSRRDQRLQDEVRALHRARPGHLQRHPPDRAARRGWHRVRRRFAVRQDGGKHRDL